MYYLHELWQDCVAGISLSLGLDHLLLWMTWRRHNCNAVCGEGGYDCHAPAQGLGFKQPTLPLRGFLEILGVSKLSSTLSLSLLKRLLILARFNTMLCAAPYLSETVSMRWCFILSLVDRTTEELRCNDVTTDYEQWWQGVQAHVKSIRNQLNLLILIFLKIKLLLHFLKVEARLGPNHYFLHNFLICHWLPILSKILYRVCLLSPHQAQQLFLTESRHRPGFPLQLWYSRHLKRNTL
jgi:hypothetical protein